MVLTRASRIISVEVSRHSPDTGGVAASIALLTGFGNGKSPSPQAKDSRDLRLRHSNVEARPTCILARFLRRQRHRRSARHRYGWQERRHADECRGKPHVTGFHTVCMVFESQTAYAIRSCAVPVRCKPAFSPAKNAAAPQSLKIIREISQKHPLAKQYEPSTALNSYSPDAGRAGGSGSGGAGGSATLVGD